MPPSTSTAAPVSTPSQPVSDLSLSPEELKICEKWITPYSALETAEDRLKMLRGAILPRLTLVNTGMAEESWKARKSVSMIYPS
jgi:hypothetical protein